MKHDKLKSECFKIGPNTGQKKNNFMEKKKVGKFKSIQKIIDKNKEINNMVTQLSSNKGGFNSVNVKKKLGSLTMSNAHLQRLNKIHERFQRSE
jgi:DNA-binding FrmR family transcriptional regulator